LTQNAEEAAELKKKRTFRKFSYRGIDLDQYVSPLTHLQHPFKQPISAITRISSNMTPDSSTSPPPPS
jgi:hypothetical protein